MNLEAVFSTFPEMETERLRLRELRAHDARSLFGVLGDAGVIEFYDDDVLTDISQAHTQIEAWGVMYERRRSVRWGIVHLDKDELIGTCGFYGFHTLHQRAGIGYELNRAFWRRGIMTEALAAILKFGFERVKLNRVEAVVMLDNRASVGLLKGLGFEEEGILRQYENWGVQKGLVDVRMFSLLKETYSG